MIVELIMELLFYGVQSLLPSRDKSRTVGPATWRFPVESAVERERERELWEEAQNREYRAQIMTIEVGSRGVDSVKGFKAF